MEWVRDEVLSTTLLRNGHENEARVAEELRKRGVLVAAPEKKIRKSYASRHSSRDTIDLWVVSPRLGKWVSVSVKERYEHFTSAYDFPHETIIVDTRRKLEANNPTITVCTSETTRLPIWCTPSKPDVRQAMATVRLYDRTRRYPDNFAILHRTWWYDGYDSFVSAL